MEPTKTQRRAPNGQFDTSDSVEPQVTLGQRIDRICDATQTAWGGGREALSELKSVLDVDGRVDRNPYAMMAAAAGSGYVLAGGVFSPLTARVVGLGLRLGLRLAAIPFLQRELLGLVDASNESGKGSSSPGHQAQTTTATSKQQETT